MYLHTLYHEPCTGTVNFHRIANKNWSKLHVSHLFRRSINRI